MDQKNVSPNDFKVVSFKNTTDFTFTPEMGCMYDGRPISGMTGAPGINGGESMTLPYHIGHRLAENLAKIVQLRKAPIVDEANNPVGKPLWSTEHLEELKQTFLTELYSEQKPVQQSETDRLFALVEQYKKLSEDLINKVPVSTEPMKVPEISAITTPSIEPVKGQVFQDKGDVIAELEKRGVKFDRRLTKENLQKLIV